MVGRMDIFRDCCDQAPVWGCCGESPASTPTTMLLEMTNWSTAKNPGVPYIGDPWTSADSFSIDFTPFNGTHVLDNVYPIVNYNVAGTINNSSRCAWGKVFTIPITWTNRISHVVRTDNLVILAELLDSAARVSSLHLRVLYPTSYDVAGTWYQTAWANEGIYFSVQGMPSSNYLYDGFLIDFTISQSVSLSLACSDYDLEYPGYSVTIANPPTKLAVTTLTSAPNFHVLAP